MPLTRSSVLLSGTPPVLKGRSRSGIISCLKPNRQQGQPVQGWGSEQRSRGRGSGQRRPREAKEAGGARLSGIKPAAGPPPPHGARGAGGGGGHFQRSPHTAPLRGPGEKEGAAARARGLLPRAELLPQMGPTQLSPLPKASEPGGEAAASPPPSAPLARPGPAGGLPRSTRAAARPGRGATEPAGPSPRLPASLASSRSLPGSRARPRAAEEADGDPSREPRRAGPGAETSAAAGLRPGGPRRSDRPLQAPGASASARRSPRRAGLAARSAHCADGRLVARDAWRRLTQGGGGRARTGSPAWVFLPRTPARRGRCGGTYPSPGHSSLRASPPPQPTSWQRSESRPCWVPLCSWLSSDPRPLCVASGHFDQGRSKDEGWERTPTPTCSSRPALSHGPALGLPGPQSSHPHPRCFHTEHTQGPQPGHAHMQTEVCSVH